VQIYVKLILVTYSALHAQTCSMDERHFSLFAEIQMTVHDVS
jgi:hypothetical protein